MANYSTYARAVLSNSESIAKIIRQYSVQQDDSNQLDLSPFALLSMTEIEQALTNPQNALENKIRIFAELIKMHREIIKLQEEGHHQQLRIETSMKIIRERFSKADKIKKDMYTETVKELEKEYKGITKLLAELEQQERELSKFQQRLDNMTIEHDKEWDAYRHKYLAILAEQLEEKGIPLTELEKNELLNRDIWADVVKRFEIQELDIPDDINIARPDYLTYFELKAYLAIHASLSRRMLPSSEEDIYNA